MRKQLLLRLLSPSSDLLYLWILGTVMSLLFAPL